MNLKDTIDFHIKGTWHTLTKMYNRLAAQHDTSQTIAYILVNIDKEGTPATRVAQRLGMEPTSLSRVLKKMEDQKLIFKKVDDNDKRIMKIFLTDCGIEKRKTVKKIVIDFNEKLLKKVNKSDLKTFYKVLKTINELAYEENPANSKSSLPAIKENKTINI
ncbi:MAG: winged helix-turn-helix transcriptional regulator [Chlorobi bacterium]|nr:winged helix-turn-helix transcriptional regulator [Chlorobiota bacterium]